MGQRPFFISEALPAMRIFRSLFAALFLIAAFSTFAPAFAAETTITPVTITSAGASSAVSAANVDGSKFRVPADDRTFIRVTNADSSTHTITLVAQTTSARVPGVGVVAIDDIDVTVAANTGDVLIGPITPAYIDSSGYAHVTFDAVTSVSVAVFRLPAAQ